MLFKNQAHYQLFLLSSVVAMSALISYCHSKDLGGEAPDKVQINAELADWDHGAGEVIQQKCANCHRADRTQTVPGNTPHVLDDIGNPAFFRDPKNRGMISAMKRRVTTQDSEKIMPPRFGTPLYDDEKSALLAFFDAAIKSFDAVPKPTPAPTPSGGPTPTPTQKLMFADVQSIAAAACSRCHDGIGDNPFPLITREDFAGAATSALAQIKQGDMPLDDATFKDTVDGKKLIEWLSGSLE